MISDRVSLSSAEARVRYEEIQGGSVGVLGLGFRRTGSWTGPPRIPWSFFRGRSL